MKTLALLAATMLPSAAFAADTTVASAPTPSAGALRLTGSVSPFDTGTLGLEVHRQAASYFGVSGILAMAKVGEEEGGRGEILARFGLYGDQHALTFGIGPSLLIATGFGPVAFLETEIAYEYRTRSGVSFVLAAGPSTALNTSPDTCTSTGLLGCFLDTTQFVAGRPTPRVRAGLGVAF